MSSPINTSDLSVSHLHTVDNDDSESDGGGGLGGGGGGHVALVLVVVVVVHLCPALVAWCRLPGTPRHSPILIYR